jgi:hypothetical protein
MTQKGLIETVAQAIADGQAARRASAGSPRPARAGIRAWLPSRGNFLLTALTVSALLFANRAGALTLFAPNTSSTQVMPYQGRLAAAGGAPLTGNYAMTFALYDVAMGGVPLWSETWTGPNSVTVRDGLFNVALGSLAAIPQSAIANRANIWLGITVGSDTEMNPRVQLGSVPFAVQALTVPDGAITTAKIADGSVTATKLANDAIGGFGGRPNSYPHITHLTNFLLCSGCFGNGNAPGDAGDPFGLPASLNYFTDGEKLYSPSGNGYIETHVGGVGGSPRWGYGFSFFLNNIQAARTISVETTTCNDLAIYTSTGPVAPNFIGTSSTQLSHRFPGNNHPNVNNGCPCEAKTQALAIPSGDFRLTFLTRGADCTSYLVVGARDTNWITDAGLTVDWPNLRTYIGEQ